MSDWKTKLENGAEEAVTAACLAAIPLLGGDLLSLWVVDWSSVLGISGMAGLLAFIRVFAFWNKGKEKGTKLLARTPQPTVDASTVEDFSEFDEWPAEDA